MRGVLLMFSPGPMELVIVLALGVCGVGGFVALFFVIRAAIQSGNRDSHNE